MKLIRCQIENFGCLSHERIDFRPGLNSLCRGNGMGKTTLAAFLRAMLYGLPGCRSNSKTYEDRRRYCPYDGSPFGGSVILEARGSRWEICRRFDPKSETKDTLRVFRGGAETSELGAVPGQTLLGLDEESFVRTAFMGGAEPLKGVTAEMGARLNRFENSDADYTSARAALEAAARAIRPARGQNGSLPQLHGKILALRQEIANLQDMASSLDKKCAQYEALSAADAQDRRRYKAQQQLALEQERWDTWCRLREQWQSQEKRLEDIKLPPAEAEEELRRLENSLSGQENALLQKENDPRPMKPGVFLLAAALCLLFAGGAAVLALFYLVPGLVLGGVCLAGCLVFSLFWLRSKKRDTQRKNALAMLRQQLRQTRDQRRELLARWDLPEDTQAKTLEAQRRMLRSLQETCRVSRQQAQDYFQNHRPQKPQPRREDPVTRQTLERNTQSLLALEGEMDRLEYRLEQLPVKQQELQACLEQEQQLHHRLVMLYAAIENLDKAQQTMKERYLDPVAQRLLHYAALVSQAYGEDVVMDRDFTLRFRMGGMPRSHRHLSAGETAAWDLCLRLALADVMYPEEKPFLILDDPFESLDETHMEKIARLLAGLSGEYQLLYLTCHPSRAIPG